MGPGKRDGVRAAGDFSKAHPGESVCLCLSISDCCSLCLYCDGVCQSRREGEVDGVDGQHVVPLLHCCVQDLRQEVVGGVTNVNVQAVDESVALDDACAVARGA